MTFIEILIEVVGWAGSVLIVGAYALNLNGKLDANDLRYIWTNIIGAIFFMINSYSHGAMPSFVVNIIWIGFAINSIIQLQKAKKV
jgi:hypothetical protein